MFECCFNCDKRTQDCHGKCAEYLDAKVKFAELKAKRKAVVADDYHEYMKQRTKK